MVSAQVRHETHLPPAFGPKREVMLLCQLTYNKIDFPAFGRQWGVILANLYLFDTLVQLGAVFWLTQQAVTLGVHRTCAAPFSGKRRDADSPCQNRHTMFQYLIERWHTRIALHPLKQYFRNWDKPTNLQWVNFDSFASLDNSTSYLLRWLRILICPQTHLNKHADQQKLLARWFAGWLANDKETRVDSPRARKPLVARLLVTLAMGCLRGGLLG